MFSSKVKNQVAVVVSAVAGLTGVMPLLSQAQESAEPRLEEVLVTAQRRVESLQKAPLSVTAFSAQTIEELELNDLESLTRFSPNVTVTKVPGSNASASVRIRGVGNPEVAIWSDPKVTVYLDDVLIAKTSGAQFDLIDLERIELLRGPQGTLFGRNAVGGAVAVHSREPANELDFRQDLDAGNLDLFESQTMINVPLIDNEVGTLAARAVYMYRERDGWADNDAGDQWQVEDRNAGRFSLAWTAPNWRARYIYDQTRWRDTTPAVFLLDAGEFEPGAGTPKSDALAAIAPGRFAAVLESLGREERTLDEFVQPGRGRVAPGEFVGKDKLDVLGHSLTLNRDVTGLPLLGDVTLKSITAYRKNEQERNQEFDGTPIELLNVFVNNQTVEQFTQELQVVGKTFQERLDYILGFYYFDEDGDQAVISRSLDFTSVGDPAPFSEIDTNLAVDNEAWAVFGQGTLADVFTDGMNFTVGLRYTQETRGIEVDRLERQFGTLLIAGCDPALPDFDAAGCKSFDMDASEDFDNVSWMANLAYEWNDNHMSYTRVATGFLSGGFNGRATSLFAVTRPFEEETAISYEVGMKSSLLDQRLNVNWAAFYTETDDLQTAGFPPDAGNPNVGTIINNAGQSTSYGAEVELQSLLTQNLEAYLSAAWIDNEFNEFVIGFDDVDGDGVRETPVDVSDGNVFIRTPEFTVAAGLRYNFGEIGIGRLSARLDVSWQDDVIFNGGSAVQTVNAPELDRGAAKDRPANQQDAYALVDAMVTLEDIPLVDDGNLKLSLWGRNITDKQYRNVAVDLMENLGILIGHYGDPRTYGVTLSYSLR